MPNWTNNICTVKGSEHNIKELLNTIQNKDDTVDITNINPVPKDLQDIHSGSAPINGEQHEVWLVDDEGMPKSITEFTQSKLLKLYGAKNPIDWQYKNWGTKWGDCGTKINIINANMVELYFDSAWGEPFILLDDLSKQFKVVIENNFQIEFEEDEHTSMYPLSIMERSDIDAHWKKSLDEQKELIKNMVISTNEEE